MLSTGCSCKNQWWPSLLNVPFSLYNSLFIAPEVPPDHHTDSTMSTVSIHFHLFCLINASYFGSSICSIFHSAFLANLALSIVYLLLISSLVFDGYHFRTYEVFLPGLHSDIWRVLTGHFASFSSPLSQIVILSEGTEDSLQMSYRITCLCTIGWQLLKGSSFHSADVSNGKCYFTVVYSCEGLLIVDCFIKITNLNLNPIKFMIGCHDIIMIDDRLHLSLVYHQSW